MQRHRIAARRQTSFGAKVVRLFSSRIIRWNDAKRYNAMADPQPTKTQPTRKPAHVLFFAAVPPDQIKDQIAEAWRSTGTGESFRRETLHMSLLAIAGLDMLDPILVDRAQRAALAVRHSPFELRFDRLMTFGGQPGNSALVIGTDGHNHHPNDLSMGLHHALKSVGLVPPNRKKVTPHLTLAYGPGFSHKRHLIKPICWTIRDFTLVDSLQGQGRHVPLGTWPLIESGPQPGFDF